MKRAFLPLFCLAICLIMTNCSKSDGKIEYPTRGSHGPNLLKSADSVKVTLLELYSLAADLDKKSEPLEVHLINLNDSVDTLQWSYEPNTINGWNISPFDTISNLQKLRSFEFNHIDVGIKFSESGPFRLEVYENDQSTPVRSTIIKGIKNNN